MALPTFDPDRFSAALVRQWQRFGLPDAQEMSPDQWWQALSGALAELLADSDAGAAQGALLGAAHAGA